MLRLFGRSVLIAQKSIRAIKNLPRQWPLLPQAEIRMTNRNGLGKIIKQQRVMKELNLH